MTPDAPPTAASPELLERVLVGISVLTAASGVLQLLAPGLVLKQLAGSRTATSRHLFATIGMFMVAAGGTLFSSLQARDTDPKVLGWVAGQKVGASIAVAAGVRHDVFSRRALPVAAFDLASAVACVMYRRRLVSSPAVSSPAVSSPAVSSPAVGGR